MPDEEPTLAGVLIQALEDTQPIFDAADGIKADMLKRGWSNESAEAVALQWLCGSMKRIWSH